MRFFQFLLFLFFSLLCLGSFFIIVYGYSEAQKEEGNGVLITGIVISAIVMLCTYALFKSMTKSGGDKRSEAAIRDGQILSFAASKGGQITPSELATTGHFSIEDARKYLEKMHENGVCEKRWIEGEINIYTFKGLMQDDQKEASAL